MPNFFSLPLTAQTQLSQDALLKYYGVTIPATTADSQNKLALALNAMVPLVNQINSALWQGPLGPGGFGQPDPGRAAAARAAYNSPIPPDIQNQLSALVPSGYSFEGTLGQFSVTLNAVYNSIDNLAKNPIQLPASGASVTVTPTSPALPPTITPTPKPPAVVPLASVVTPPVVTPTPKPPAVVPLAPVVIPPVVTPTIQKSTDILSTVLGAGALVVGVLNVIDALTNTATGLSAEKQSAQGKATQQDVANFKKKEDWRVRLSLAPSATYLYKDPAITATDLLYPLQSTDGVIFPYTPAISVAYAAHYDSSTLTHSNYKIFQYGSSSVDSITITCDFTAQDTSEANYLLAVIHFFKSATKMFYGQDENPKPGTPPPLCYLSGLGDFQFDAHPLAITGFNYTLPTDVDYIRAGRSAAGAGVNTSPTLTKDGGSLSATVGRLVSSLLTSGAQAAPPKFGLTAASLQSTSDATYVPTKMSLSITAIPIVTRNDISNNFSLKDYATGKLLQGSKRQGGGIW